MNKVVRIALFVTCVLIPHLALAVSEDGTGAPQITDDKLQTVPSFLQWLLSFLPF